MLQPVDSTEVETNRDLAISILSFASTHIGMSAIRSKIIDALGKASHRLKLVGNPRWKLPKVWRENFSDGADTIFPNSETAGRQLYRALYTVVSFVTLGAALHYYLEYRQLYLVSANDSMSNDNSFNSLWLNGYYWTAIAAQAAATASLVNASPLGLMPGFEGETSGNSKTLLLKRNDALKFQIRGLTRITRHPLILPVVPWGIANAVLLGSDWADWIFFGGLALYAIVGCAAQDLRVIRQEGSVGTTFGDYDQLQTFFEHTSFIPFGAVLQGKQSMQDIVAEVPWSAIGGGIVLGYVFENILLHGLMQ